MIQLFNEDCAKVLQSLPSNSVDLVACDPPYGVLNKRNPAACWDSTIDMAEIWGELHRVCKEDAAIVLFGQGFFSAQLIMSNPKNYRYTLIWDKVNRPTGFLNANRRPLQRHEDLLVFYKRQPTYNPQFTIGKPNHNRKSGGKSNIYGSYKAVAKQPTNQKSPVSILRVEKEHLSKFHPTQKPIKLMEWIVQTYSNEGDVVLDFCMGSGSTGVACMNTGRSFIGIELDADFFETAKKRIYASNFKQGRMSF